MKVKQTLLNLDFYKDPLYDPSNSEHELVVLDEPNEKELKQTYLNNGDGTMIYPYEPMFGTRLLQYLDYDILPMFRENVPSTSQVFDWMLSEVSEIRLKLSEFETIEDYEAHVDYRLALKACLPKVRELLNRAKKGPQKTLRTLPNPLGTHVLSRRERRQRTMDNKKKLNKFRKEMFMKKLGR